MSLILEALKKSDRQRHQQKATKEEVRQRTLAMPANRASRSRYLWPVIIIVLLIIAGGWFISNLKSSNDVASSLSKEAVPAISEPAKKPLPPVVAEPTKRAASDLPPIAVEPAPIPRRFEQTETLQGQTNPPAKSNVTADSQRVLTSTTTSVDEQQIKTRSLESAEPRAIEEVVTEQPKADYTLYEDLPRELRSQMPKLEKSMHFYTEAPERRLARINGRLLHEGDWVERDLQVVEILPDGVLLDYLGKTFELSNFRQ